VQAFREASSSRYLTMQDLRQGSDLLIDVQSHLAAVEGLLPQMIAAQTIGYLNRVAQLCRVEDLFVRIASQCFHSAGC